jgi:glycine hydroxymethyltransferase
MDLTPQKITGQQAQVLLDSVGITVNKNLVPYDTRTPLDPSGIRLGTPALTSRGFREEDMMIVGKIIAEVLTNPQSKTVLNQARQEIKKLTGKHPLYSELN